MNKIRNSALAIAGVLALGGASAFAQAPQDPPARFAGTVTVNGAPAPAGTTVTAMVGAASCGATTIFSQGGASNYVIDVEPNSTENPGCGTVDSTVTLMVNGAAAGSGPWLNYQLNQLNLTVGQSTVTPTTTATVTATTTTTTTPSGTATATTTPRAPDTGSGQGGGEAAPWLLLAGGALALAGGASVAARKRIPTRD